MEKTYHVPKDLYKHVSKVTELNLNDCWIDTEEICDVLKAFGGQLKCLHLVCGELARKIKRDIVRYAHGLDCLMVSFQTKKNDEFLGFLNRRMNCRIEQSMLCYGKLH
jgi:Ran GTPase-activating protein (RanGAP) involved in mRNA processing and transport